MLKKLFTETAKDLFSFPEPTIHTAKATLVMVKPIGSRGSGVLVGPNTVITVLHNVDHRPLENIIIRRPHTGETSGITDAKPFPYLDLAILTLETPLAPPFAAIDDLARPMTGTPVMMPRFFKPGFSSLTKDGEFCFSTTLHKGFLYNKGFVSHLWGEEEVWACSMRLGATFGDSGAGVFSKAGGLITLLREGSMIKVSGPAISGFREVMRGCDIPRLSQQ